MSTRSSFERIDPPAYYDAVRNAAHSFADQQGIVFNSGQDGVDEFESLVSGNEPSWPSYPEGRERLEVTFLDEKGEVVTNLRLAVAALVVDSTPTATVYFGSLFNQPVSTSGPRFAPYSPPETIHEPPIMSNWQAEQIVSNPATYLDYLGRARVM